MKKFAKILCILIVAVLIASVLYFTLAFLGNPVSYILTKHSVKAYMEENYADTDFQTSAVNYNFKTGSYYVRVNSPSSVDSHFTLYFDGWGNYRYDTYDSITNLSNTVARLDSEYRKLVDSKLYEGNGTLNSGIAYGELRIAGVYEIHTYATEEGATEYYTLDKEYGLDRSALEIDGEYDIRELARTAGLITLDIHDEEVSVERAAELLLQVKDYLDENEVPFYAIHFDLHEPRNEDGQLTGDTISVYDFLYSDIYPEGLCERIQENWDALQEHYAIQDAETARLVEAYAEANG